MQKALKVFLIKDTEKGNTRYYNLQIFATLFDEFMLERVYGNIRYKSHTGIKKDYFLAMADAKKKYDFLLRQKIAKGYSFKC